MALAQPTGLTVQGLTPLVTVEQTVTRENAAQDLVTLKQVVVPAGARINPARTLVTLQQTVKVIRENPALTVTLQQTVSRENPARTRVTLRQSVLSVAQAAAQPMRIYLDGTDITDICSRDVSISASEGDNRIAEITLVRLPKGPLDVPSFQGRSLEISRIQDGQPVALFTGWVDEPRYTRAPPRLELSCSDLRNERVGKHDQSALKQLTGGLFSPVTQRDDATGEAWVSELMRTVEGSLDYTGAGALRYRPWALGAPRFTLTPGEVHYRDAETVFATRSSIVNRINATLEYRHFRRNVIAHAVSLSVETNEYCKLAGCLPAAQIEDEEGNLVDQIFPSKNALLSAAQSVSGWSVGSLTYKELPPNGWYRKTSDVTRKRNYYASELVRNTRAMGADVELERYISQAKRETYALTLEAPESVEQYGEIVGSDMRFAVETRVVPEIYEERGCAVVSDPDDRRADVELAIQCIQRMASKKIKEGHRQNLVAYRYKPGTKRLLPVEIGDVLDVSTGEIDAIGFVAEFEHRTDSKGDAWTDLRLAVSRVDSGLSVTEDWSLPTAPSTYKLTPRDAGQLETPDCPAPVGEVEIEGDSRIEPDGTVIIVAPAVDRSQVDEISGTRAHTYSVQIPKDQLSVEVI